MLSLQEFYRGFQVNYFTYRQLRLKRELNSIEKNEISFSEDFFIYDKSDHLRSIKIDIRQTYFQAIETVFSLIIALKPNADGHIDENNILVKLSQKQHHFGEIKKFGFDEGGLEFLNMKLKLDDGNEITALHYFFYMSAGEDNFREIPESIKAIEYGLKILARDISDRREYNSMKHGLRIYRALNSFKFGSKQHDTMLNYDLRDSMTFYDENEKTKEIEFVTKIFDSERDMHMTLLCSKLISNIIYFRRVMFLGFEDAVPLHFFSKSEIDEWSKVNVNAQNFTFRIPRT